MRLAPFATLLALVVAGCIAHERLDRTPLDLCDVPQIVRVSSFEPLATIGVDVLVLVDSSSSMVGLDDAVRNQIRDGIAVMSDGDVNNDGIREVVPERSMRVAIVDMDLGVLGAASDPSCAAGDGDAARTHTSSATCTQPLRSARPDGVLEYVQGGPVDGDTFADEVRCAMEVGTSGCRYARGMDALIAALDPARGLVRTDAQVFLMIVTGQDDCSTSDPSVFSSSAAPALRCHEGAARLRPVAEVADAIVARFPRPEFVTLAVYGGMPVPAGNPTPENILADPSMIERIDPAAPGTLVAACSRLAGSATPARRWVELAHVLESRGIQSTLRSICLTPGDVFEHWFGSAENTLRGVCVGNDPAPALDASSRARCEVLVTLPPIGHGALAEHCSELAFANANTLDHIATTTAADGTTERAEVCRIHDASREPGLGWALDSSITSAHCPSLLSFERQGLRAARVDVVCDTYALATAHHRVHRDMPCTADTAGIDSSVRCADGHAIDDDDTSAALACDAFTGSCQVPCVSDADCQILGEHLRCDLRSPNDFFLTRVPASLPARRGFCFDPMCDPNGF